MKTRMILFLSLVLSISAAFAQASDAILAQANARYAAGDRETAQKLYLIAAEKGNAEAHFALAYKYHLTPAEAIYHYSEAAKKGHAEALGYALDYLLFRANRLRLADPQKALAVYTEAKQARPDLTLYDEENVVRILKMCAAPKGFQVESFIKQYALDDTEIEGYATWELAEEASIGGRFGGKPDPDLVFNLVIRGGVVPAELMSAVQEVYDQWKQGGVQEFDLCDHVTSGEGQYYCISRVSAAADEMRQGRLDSLKQKLGSTTAALLETAYSAAVNFIEAKAETEEGYGGTGRAACITASEMEQKDQYVELLTKIQAGFTPAPENSLVVADQQLNATYRQVLRRLQDKAAETIYPFTTDDIRRVQRLWLPYRDATVDLWTQIRPQVDQTIWKSWLTELRTQALQAILETEY